MESLLKISPIDNVAVAIKELKIGDCIKLGDSEILIKTDIPFGHKVALVNIPTASEIIKYGHRIGFAKCDITCGELVNENNLKTALSGIGNYEYTPHINWDSNTITNSTFNGFLRHNGEVGIRNELWIVPLVACVNCVANALVEKFRNSEYAKYTDGIFALCHSYGCSQLGCDHENTRKILADLCKHPNAGGVLVLGLGCENNKLTDFKEALGDYDTKRVKFLQAQSSIDEVTDAFELLKELATNMKSDSRTSQPLSKLRIGLKCGGSDAFSGITANVLIGKFADKAIHNSASCALCEVPEMFGAETLLMNRAKTRKIFENIVDMINSFKSYFIKNEMPIYENPSPGNKAGGISTLEEKSLGCVQKGGTSPVCDVLRYADRIKESGLSLLESPGNDPIAATALAAAGCQIILFSTGRGTPFSCVVPTVKISSNTPLYQKKSNWIDFNAGQILDGKNADTLCDEFYDFILQIANGKKTQGELHNYKEIAIFKTGVTL